MQFYFIMVFLLQVLSSSCCHAVYLLSKDGHPLAFDEWRATQHSIHQQVWLEEKRQEELDLPVGVQSFFVPDSLIQAFALEQLHQGLRKKVQERLGGSSIDQGYVDFEGIPFIFIHPDYEASGDKTINKAVTTVYTIGRSFCLRDDMETICDSGDQRVFD